MLVLTNEEMRAADRHAIEQAGIPSLVLMENAGREVVAAMERVLGDLADASVLVLCGRGNNGGDGMVVTRLLLERGVAARALLLAEPRDLSEDARAQWASLERFGQAARTCSPHEWHDMRDELDRVDLVVDALLGTGRKGALTGFLAEVVEDLNASEVPVVAVDVPTGLSGDSARVEGPAVMASLTVTFAAPKVCHVFAPACEACGELVVADIGIPERSLAASGATLRLTDDGEVAALVAPLCDRPRDSHKGTWGHVVVVGGSVGKSGAPALSALGALVSGAGLVTVATPAPCVGSVAAHAPELMQLPLPATESGEVADSALPVDDVLARASALVVGPGLGTGAGAARLVRELIDHARVPVVLDADALNVLAAAGTLPPAAAERPLILTPHPGEFERLLAGLGSPSRTSRRNQHERLDDARSLARRSESVVVLKGFRTLVAAPDPPVHVASTGNPGMGTAGVGDVLAGMIGGLLAQGLSPRQAAIAAVHLHGRAGDLAEREVGQMALRATDVVRHWAAAVRSLAGSEGESA